MLFVADYFKHSGNQSSDMMSQGALMLPLEWQQPNQMAWTYFLATYKQLACSAKHWFWQYVKAKHICRKQQTQD